MYTLELTKGERDAIDWIGDRYAHGWDLGCVLRGAEMTCPYPEIDGVEWEDNVPIEFDLTEGEAWLIKEIIEEDEGLTCFGDVLKRKLFDLVEKIV